MQVDVALLNQRDEFLEFREAADDIPHEGELAVDQGLCGFVDVSAVADDVGDRRRRR